MAKTRSVEGALVLAVIAVGLAGCSTDDPQPESQSPNVINFDSKRVSTCDGPGWSCLDDVAKFLDTRLYAPDGAQLATAFTAFRAPSGSDGSVDITFTLDGHDATLRARQDDSEARPAATPPAGASPGETVDVAGSAGTISDGIAYWSNDGWNYALKTKDGGEITAFLDSLTSVDPPS